MTSTPRDIDDEEFERLADEGVAALRWPLCAPKRVVLPEAGSVVLMSHNMYHRGTRRRDEAPLALVGKGVVFDSGGISIKPAAGMEEMTMDMGGAGVVAGTMRALALRRAKAMHVAWPRP